MTSTGAGTPVQRSNEAAPWRTSTSRPSTTSQPAARPRRRAPSRVRRRGRRGRPRSGPRRGSTSSSSRTGVAFTTSSRPSTSGGHVAASREDAHLAAAAPAASALRARRPRRSRHARSRCDPGRAISVSVLEPSTRPSRNTSVLTDSPLGLVAERRDRPLVRSRHVRADEAERGERRAPPPRAARARRRAGRTASRARRAANAAFCIRGESELATGIAEQRDDARHSAVAVRGLVAPNSDSLAVKKWCFWSGLRTK